MTALALLLRAVGLSYGLPFHYHWDEPTIMNRAIRMGGGDLNPHFFYYPTLLMYVFLLAQGALYAAGHVLHVYPSGDAFLVTYLTNSTASYLVGRAVVAIAGAATVFVTFLVGRRFISPAAGLLGAAILAFSPVHVSNSHFATNDVPMALLSTLTFVFLWRIYQRGQMRDYVAAGLVIGLAISTKYLPVLLLVSLGLAYLLRIRREHEPLTWRSLAGGPLVGVGVAFAAFAVTSPYVLLDWSSAWGDYQAQAALSSAAGCSGCGLNFVPYLTDTLGWSVGWPAYLLAIAGLASIPFRRGEARMRYILLASWPLLLFLAVGSQRQAWARWLVPIAPFVALSAAAVALAAYGRAVRLLRRISLPRPELTRSVQRAMAAVALAVVLLPPAVSSGRFDQSLLDRDPRTAAVAWFEAHVPSGTRIAVQPLLDRYFFTAQLPTESQLAIEEGYVPASRVAARQLLETTYRSGPVYDDVTFSYDYDQLEAEGVRYVVISSAAYHAVDPPAEDRLYLQLRLRARLVQAFAARHSLPDAQNFPVSPPAISVYALT